MAVVILIVPVVLLAVVGVVLVASYYGLVSLEDRVESAWAQIDRRHDLIPNLVETFPSVFLARMAGVGPREYFQAEGDARGPVTVDL